MGNFWLPEKGTKFGSLSFLGESESRKVGKKTRKVFWRCLCICGSIKWYQNNNIKAGNSTSCGCTRPVNRYVKPPGHANSRFLFTNYKRHALNRGIYFSLTVEEFISITQLECWYCGAAPHQVFDAKNKQGDSRLNGKFIYNGVDRLDPSLGYDLKNCVPCCGLCNIAKRALTYSEFVKFILSIHDNLSRKGRIPDNVKTLDSCGKQRPEIWRKPRRLSCYTLPPRLE